MFGQQPATPFGGGGFGQPTNSAPAFGSPAPAPGLFGAPAQAPAFGQQAFGQPSPAPAFGGFGSPAVASPAGGGLFGAPAPTAFGGGFGAPAPAGGGLFGAPPAAPTGFGGGFGSPAPAPMFGAPAPTSLFGTPSPAPAAFGAFGAPAPGLFGAQAPAPSAFGAQAPSAFGVPTQAPTAFGGTTGLFGAPAPAPSAFGNFGAPAPSAFGAQSTSAFGAQSTPAFGAPAPVATAFGAPVGGGLFGSVAPAPAFGAPVASGGGLFGAPAVNSAGGGTRAVPFQITSRQDGTTTINLQSIAAMQQYQEQSHEELRFADYSQGNRGSVAPAPTMGGFGAPPPAPVGGLFGASPAPATSFLGNTGTGLFGSAPAPAFGAAPTSTFGAAAPVGGGLFGQSPAPTAFGAPTSTFGSLTSGFGAPAPTGGLFGTSSAPAFGAPAPSPGLFGSAPAPAPFGAPAAGGLFGSPPAASSAFGTGLFGGNPAPAPFGAPAPSLFGQPPVGGGLFGPTPAPPAYGQTAFGQPPTTFGAPTNGFGNPTPTFGHPVPGGLFGQPNPMSAQAPMMAHPPQPYQYQQQPLFSPNVQIIAPEVNEVIAQQARAIENQMSELRKAEVWTSSKSTSPASTPTATQGYDSFFPQAARPGGVITTPVRSVAKTRPRGFAKSEPPKQRIPVVRRDNSGLMSPEAYVRSSQLDLVVRPESVQKPRSLRLHLEIQASPNPLEAIERTTVDERPRVATPRATQTVSPTMANDNAFVTASPSQTVHDPGYEYYQQVLGNEVASSKPTLLLENGTPIKKIVAYMPKLTKTGYEVSPSLEALSQMSEADLASVQHFSVYRPGYGKVEWEGCVDVRHADLDSIIQIEEKEIAVYSKEEDDGTKPEVGTKLNRPAVLTYHEIFPKAGMNASPESKMKFSKKLVENTRKIGAEFVSYDADTGTWAIRVLHFSRYALIEDDSDDEVVEPVSATTPSQPYTGQRAVALRNSSNVTFQDKEISEPDDMDYCNFSVSTTERLRDNGKMLAEESAEALSNTLNQLTTSLIHPDQPIRENVLSVDPGELCIDDPPTVKERQLSLGEIAVALSKGSLFAGRFVTEKGSSSGSSTASRMRRSFRVGWLPNGSFLTLAPSSCSVTPWVVQSSPVLSEKFTDEQRRKLLEIQRVDATVLSLGDDKCPVFSISSNCQQLSSALSSTENTKHAFLLLSRLFPRDNAANMSISESFPWEARRLAAVFEMIFALCSQDFQNEAMQRTSNGLSAIFAAVVCGNLELACEAAMEGNFPLLAVMLSTGSDHQRDIKSLIAKVSKSKDLTLRPNDLALQTLNAMIGRNQELGNATNWQHCLLNQLICDPNASLLLALDRYEDSVVAGKASFPSPSYAEKSSRQAQSMYFRLLRICACPRTTTVCEAVNPDGFTHYFHDFSLPFHLSSALVKASSEKNGFFTMSAFEAEYLVDGLVAQLMLQGDWEWAVFVSLCSIVHGSRDVQRLKTKRAKDLVLRSYDGADDRETQSRRDFLERKVGIPTRWFQEALLYRAASNGKFLDCIEHACEMNVELGRDAFVELYLPLHVFEAPNEVIPLLERFSKYAAQDSLLLSLLKYFKLEEDVADVTCNPNAMIDMDEYETLSQTYNEVQKIMSRLNDMMVSRGTLSLLSSADSLLFPAPEYTVPLSSMISMVVQRSNVLKIQLDAMSRNLRS